MELVLQAPSISLEQPKKKSTTFNYHILQIRNTRGNEQAQVQDSFLISSVSFPKAIDLLRNDGGSDVDAVILDPESVSGDITALKEVTRSKAIPLVLVTAEYDAAAQKTAFAMSADDYHYGSLNGGFFKRLEFIKKVKSYKIMRGNRPYVAANTDLVPQIKLWSLKRAFDILVSMTALLLLSPLCVIIAVIIKLESKGPVFYISKRAGTGYKIFNFYKFRSMRTGSDAELQQLTHLNQYNARKNNNAVTSVFFKIKDDPRITRFGEFIRMTSLDEIPQLLNVLLGDMSLVGNRPLPLYEAEKLTKDQIAWRFLAPAGITGLWQITKRGKDNMSEDERIALDMEYAMKNSFWLDLKILISTIPAVLQKEKV